MSKRLALVWVFILLAALAASAGDVAQFVNLGFSADGKYFMFGQYGILEQGSRPWANAYIVDVAKNAFAANGTKQFVGTRSVDPGASGLGALLNVVADSSVQEKKLHIDHLLTGRPLYILVDGAQANDALEFRDFQEGTSYSVTLSQTPSAVATPKDVGASFGISVTITDKDGKAKTFAVGDPTYKRPGVKSYHIKQIILAPAGGCLVIVIQKDEQDTRGDNIRYMVETLRLK